MVPAISTLNWIREISQLHPGLTSPQKTQNFVKRWRVIIRTPRRKEEIVTAIATATGEATGMETAVTTTTTTTTRKTKMAAVA
jgi:hypothetical protein